MLLDSLKDPANYDLSYSQAENKYSLIVKAGDHVFSNPGSFTEPEGRQAIQQFRRMFSTEPVNEDIQPSQFRHEILLEKKTGGLKWHRKDPVINREKDFIPGPGLISDFADTKKWIADQEETTARSMDFKSNPDKANELLDAGDLRPYQNHVDVREGTEIIQYTLSDEHKTFFFISEQEFEEEAAANQALLKLMFLLPDSGNYYTEEMKENGFYVRIRKGGKIIATDTIECGSSDLAKEAITRISQYFTERIYALQQVTTEYQWQYTFRLGAPGLGDFPFRSAREYGSPEDAHKEAAAMVKVPDGYSVAWGNNHELQLKSKKSPAGVIATYTPGTPVADPEELSKSAADLLNMKRTLNKIILEPNSPEAGAMIIRDPVTEDGDYGYRLVRKDGYHAWYTLDGDFSDWSDRTQKIKQVYKLFEAPPAYLEICYGGDNINERKDAVSGVIWYHYLVKSIKDEFILFESTKGYTSPEDAQQAFTSEYARILTLATDPAEYGKSIGFDEVVLHDTDSCTPPARLVFIPEVTMKTFAYNHDAARDKLVALAISYPIRIIRKSDPLFVEYFGCISDPEPPADDCGCGCAKEEIDYYYYHYGRAIGDSPEWISQKYFDSPAEAHKAFHFFLVLLRYKGNYFICTDECNCHWKLYLREILAESVRRFPDRETAWGEKGVQKFICVAQSGHAFHAYQREVDCCFTFNVACSNSGLVHPCTYDTADKRDKALAKLIAASRELYESVLKNNSGLFADTSHYIGNIRQGNSPCSSNDYIKKMIYLDRSYPAAMVASAADMKMVDLYKSLDLPDKEKVLSGAHYFPVSRKKLDIPGQDVYKYFLDIRLPGFCEDDLSEPQPVNCDNPAGETVCCCSAWVSECCFDTCEEALRYYYSILPCLIERDHYISTFECECGPYGIQFYCDCETHRREPNDPAIPSEPGQPLPATTPEIPVPLAYIRTGQNIRHCCNEIVAINPQCYTTPKMVCDAIDRAKGLINAEGLHLVEHILLRTHCIDGDCNCPIPICDAYEDCRFKWPVLSDDACDKDKQYCFVPGADPYSFVATVVLPAWPERFRRKENRALISQMLYREMPSHILLRVLWVSPRDMCRFEALYHNWVKWLAHKMVCGDHNPPCELIDFLFRHKDYIWECFVCNECSPCDESSSPPDPCDFKAQHQPDPNEYVNAINRLYCWPYICPQPRQIYQGPVMEIAAAAGEPAVPEEAGEGMALDKEFDAERKIDERFHGYKVEATAIVKNSGNATAAQAIAFLNDPSPHFKNYRDLVERIAANKRHAEGKIFTATQKQTLVRLVTWYYLDQSVLNGQVEEHKTGIKTVFDHLRRNKLLPEYRQWEGKDIMRIKPEMPAGTIKKLFG